MSETTRSHGRLPWPAPDELRDDQRVVYEAIVGGPRGASSPFALTDADGRLEGPFNAMLASPALGAATQELGAAIRYHTSLSARQREIAILTLAALRRSEFEWYAHERAARDAGLTLDEIDSVGRGALPTSFDAAETVVAEATESLTTNRDLSDALHRRVVEHLGVVTMCELVSLVGYYDLLALSLRVWRTPLPEGAAPHFDRG